MKEIKPTRSLTRRFTPFSLLPRRPVVAVVVAKQLLGALAPSPFALRPSPFSPRLRVSAVKKSGSVTITCFDWDTAGCIFPPSLL